MTVAGRSCRSLRAVTEHSDAAIAGQGTERLLHRLDLERVATDDRSMHWRGYGGQNAMNMAGALFGGFVLAQTVVAAARTIPDRRIHQLQQVFLRGGQPTGPLDYHVEPLFEGRTYASSRVEVHQDGALISHATVGYTAGVDGPEREQPSTARGRLDDTVNRDEYRGRRNWQDQPVETRVVPGHEDDAEPTLDTFLRPFAPLPDEQAIHQAFLAFVSDRAFMTTAWKPFLADHGRPRGSTLDHTIWFHRPVTFDDWHVFAIEGPAVVDGRGLSQGTIHRCDDESLVATVAQQGSLRVRRD